MQMSVRSRVLDLLPILVVFAIVAAFGTFVMVQYVVREPLRVPAHEQTFAAADDGAMPPNAPSSARTRR
jgi:hypothetical protein